MNKILSIFFISCLAFTLSSNALALKVKISSKIESVQVKHGKKMIKVMRIQNQKNKLTGGFAKTSRKCPPFCSQPQQVAPGVETFGELEVINFMKTKLNKGKGILVDARTPDWHAKGTIPGSVNIPYKDVSKKVGATDLTIEEAFETFGVEETDDGWNFSKAKELVFWCNGPWCGQSPTAIKGLLALGYPAKKVKYYRGGMQLWKIFGLTVAPPMQEE